MVQPREDAPVGEPLAVRRSVRARFVRALMALVMATAVLLAATLLWPVWTRLRTGAPADSAAGLFGTGSQTALLQADPLLRAWTWILRGDAASLTEATAYFAARSGEQPRDVEAQAGLCAAHLAWHELLAHQATSSRRSAEHVARRHRRPAGQAPSGLVTGHQEDAAVEEQAAKQHLHQAQLAARAAFRLAPTSFAGNLAMAATSARLGEARQGAPFLARATKAAPGDARVLLLQALQEPAARADKTLRRIVVRAPEFTAARLAWVRVLAQQGHAADALREAQAAVVAVPGHAGAREVLRKLRAQDAAAAAGHADVSASVASRQDEVAAVAALSAAAAVPAPAALPAAAAAPTSPAQQVWPGVRDAVWARVPSREMWRQAALALAEGAGRMQISLREGASQGRRALTATLERARAYLREDADATPAPAAADGRAAASSAGPVAAVPVPAFTPPAAQAAEGTPAAAPLAANSSPPVAAPAAAPPAKPAPPAFSAATPSATATPLPAGQTAPLSATSLAASTSAALWQQGRAFEQAGQYVAAQGIFAELTRRTPGWVPPWIAYGRCALQAHRPADAQVAFRAAQDREPHNVEAARYLGEALWAEGDTRGAVAAFRRCIFLAPDSVHGEACRASLDESNKQR